MQAGRLLAAQIVPRYSGQEVFVLSLSDGGVVVGMQIAQQLHCPVGMLLVDEIELPQEVVAIAGISQDGAFTYNKKYSSGEIEEIVSEYRNVIEENKMEKMQEMQHLLGSGSLVRRDLIKGRNVVLVADGFSSGFSIDLALEFLKTMDYKKLVIAAPQASIDAVDRMHILADDLYVLNVVEDYIDTDHYYDVKDVPPHDVIISTVERLMKEWH
jgi:predicted phosphoribosyltransferase